MTRARGERIALLAAIVYLTALYLFSAWRDLPRSPHVDEMEHLHVVVLMERGLRPFYDFSEHHPPLFWSVLKPLVTATEGTAEMYALLVRARVMINVVLALGILAAALLVKRATGSVWAAILFVALLFAAGPVWRNGLGDLRPDSFALSLWWIGAAFVLLAERPWLRGAGIGLAMLAALIKPQWPVPSLVLGILFLLSFRKDLRGFLIASVVALSMVGAGVAITLTYADLPTLRFHIVTLTGAMVQEYLVGWHGHRPFFACPILFRPPTLFLAMAGLGVAWMRARNVFAKPFLVVALTAIAVACFLELYFLYPFPAVDYRFYAFWSVGAAMLLAFFAHGAFGLLPPKFERLRMGMQVAVALLVLIAAAEIVPYARPKPDGYWLFMRYLDRHRTPRDTFWLGTAHHPMDARDGSYYWFGQAEVVPVSLELAKTEEGRKFLPPLTEQDLPPCRIVRGLDPDMRFMRRPPARLTVARACFNLLDKQGRLSHTSNADVWMVRR